MSTQVALDTQGQIDRVPSSWAGRMGRIARGWWRAYWDWRARQLTIRILGALDARTLHDIGIHACEIESSVYGRGADRLRSYDRAWL